MQIRQPPSFRSSSPLGRISACNACSRRPAWCLASPRTRTECRRANSLVRGIPCNLENSSVSFFASGWGQWLSPNSLPGKERNWPTVLRAANETGKQKGSKDQRVLKFGGRKQGKKNDNVWSTGNTAGRQTAGEATNAAEKQDNFWITDNERSSASEAHTERTLEGSGNRKQRGSAGFASTRNSSCSQRPVKNAGKTDNKDSGAGTRVLVSGSLRTDTKAVLQPEEWLNSPLWQTFASSASGVWRGVGAAFSPITAEIVAVSFGNDNKCLYDARILCTVWSAEVKDEENTRIGLKRKIFWIAENPHGEQGLGEIRVPDLEIDGDNIDELVGEDVKYRGESGEATLLGELDSTVELVGAAEIESVEQDMLSIPWQDGEPYLTLAELEDNDSPSVPAVPWDSEISGAGELVVGWEQGEGALGNGELSEQATLEQINEEWMSIVEQNEKMDKRWEDVDKIEDGPNNFGTEGGLPANPLTTPDVQQNTPGMVDDVMDIISPPISLTGVSDSWNDVMEEDFMGQEDGLVFFEDGSYSRGPLRLFTQTMSGDDKHAFGPTFQVEQCLVWGGHKRLRVVHTISLDGDEDELQVLRVAAYEEEWMGPASTESISETAGKLVPFSQRSRLSPKQLTGDWKMFAVTASVIHPAAGKPDVAYSCKETSVTRSSPAFVMNVCSDDGLIRDSSESSVLYLPGGISVSLEISEHGTLTVGAGWLLEDGTRIAVERDYDEEGRLVEVRSLSEVKGGWIGGRM